MNEVMIENFINFCDSEIIMESLREGKSLKYTKLLKYDIPKALKNAKKSNYSTDNIDALEEILILIDDAIDQLSQLEPDMLDKALSKGSSLLYTLHVIYRSRTLLGNLNYHVYGSWITKITRILIEEGIARLPAKLLSISEKEKVIDNKIVALREYKEIINYCIRQTRSMTNVSEAYMYDIYPATEGLSEVGKSISMGIQNLIYRLKILIQQIESWINEKIFKLFKSKYIKIDIDYYMQSMKLANQIKNSSNSIETWLQIIRKSMDIIDNCDDEFKIKSKIEELKNLYSLIEEEIDTWKRIKHKEITIKPKDQQKLIAISYKDIDEIISILNSKNRVSKNLMKEMIIYSRNLKNMSKKKETICKVISTNYASITNIQSIKSKLCIDILNGIISNGTIINAGNVAY